MLSALAVPALLASVLSAPAATPPPGDISIDSVRQRGSGCSVGAVGAQAYETGGRSWIGLLFPRFAARSGAGHDSAEAQRSCRIDLELDLPDGWTVAVDNFGFAVAAHVDPGMTSQVTVTAQGDSSAGQGSASMAGPKDGTFNAGPFTLDRMSYVSCDGPKRLRLTTEIALTGTAADPSARNFSTFISPGGALNTYWLIWKKCP